jgi:hypothetical protein
MKGSGVRVPASALYESRARMPNMRSPARLIRYLARPLGGTYKERYEAMSPAEKEDARWRKTKLNGFFLTFADMKQRPKRRNKS